MSRTWSSSRHRPAIRMTALALEACCVLTLVFFTFTSHYRGAGITWLVLTGVYAISIASAPKREPWHGYLVTALQL